MHRGVMNVMTELQVDYIDNLVISVDDAITNKELDGIWRQIENEVSPTQTFATAYIIFN